MLSQRTRHKRVIAVSNARARQSTFFHIRVILIAIAREMLKPYNNKAGHLFGVLAFLFEMGLF